MTASDPLSLRKDGAADSIETQSSIQDSQAVLRHRIEQEELVKFREEQMRAEIRARLASEHPILTRPQEMPQMAGSHQPIIVNVTNSVNNASSSESVATATASAQVNSTASSVNRPSYWVGFFLNFFIPGLGMLILGAMGWGFAWFVATLTLIGMFQGVGVALAWVGMAFHYRALYRQKWP